MMKLEKIENINITDETYLDLSRIFDMMSPSMIRKINPNFVDFIKKKASKVKRFSTINPYIPIREQKLSKEVEIILGMIYVEYLQ